MFWAHFQKQKLDDFMYHSISLAWVRETVGRASGSQALCGSTKTFILACAGFCSTGVEPLSLCMCGKCSVIPDTFLGIKMCVEEVMSHCPTLGASNSLPCLQNNSCPRVTPRTDARAWL